LPRRFELFLQDCRGFRQIDRSRVVAGFPRRFGSALQPVQRLLCIAVFPDRFRRFERDRNVTDV
jgi:hypothetical protein